MDQYIDFSGGHAAAPEGAEDIAAGSSQPAQQPFAKLPYPLNPAFPMSCDIKPRLTKEQHDVLESHFQQQNKPNTNTKKTFAENLNVSLDKVNNWFQNRRAKSKQDAKKKNGEITFHSGQQHNFSDSDTSPGFVDPSSAYHAQMREWNEEQGLGISQMHPAHQHALMHGLPVQAAGTNGYLMPYHSNNDMFNSQEEVNRRTLTQEQFDAMERDGIVPNGSIAYNDLESSLYVDQNGFPMFAESHDDFKQQDVFAFPHPAGAPMGSYDSTIPSSNSEQSLSAFPSSSNLQPQASVSTADSDWAGSRSSSIQEGIAVQMPMQQPVSTTTAQWQPGQSVPVDSNQQYEEFRQVAAQAAQARTSPQQSLFEQPLAWPDDAFARRGSSASVLAHSMSQVGIQTPPQLQGNFRSPAPPSNIAARRQRAPRPATLGLGSIRSQSHGGAVHPTSPGQVYQQQQHQLADQHLRRIRSSNYIGGIAQGRVMKGKSTPGSAQRSPAHFTFAEAGPTVRHTSSGSLAPPTPMSPIKKEPNMEQSGHHHPMQVAAANMSQESISETDLEHGLDYQQAALAQGQNWTSPPHTPMYYPQQFAQQHVHSENTPPQSAPASQTCFPSTVFAHPQAMQSQPSLHQVHMSHPQQQYLAAVAPEHQMQALQPNVTYMPTQPVPISAGPAQAMQFPAQGVPIVDANGQLQLAFPAPQLAFMPQQGHHTPPHHSQTHTPPQVGYAAAFGTVAGSNPPPANDFFVHEYTPPESVKRSATPRKGPVDTVPKVYAFTHTGPDHFEEKSRKSSTKDSATSSSPASSAGTAASHTS